MLGVGSYAKDYVQGCRARIDAQLAAWAKLRAAAAHTLAEPEIAALEQTLFGALALALDHMFAHRLRGVEGKDGNPLNEMRMICGSLLEGGGVLMADRTIKYDPAQSVLKMQVGDEIKLNAGDFKKLSAAVFDEIERKYP